MVRLDRWQVVSWEFSRRRGDDSDRSGRSAGVELVLTLGAEIGKRQSWITAAVLVVLAVRATGDRHPPVGIFTTTPLSGPRVKTTRSPLSSAFSPSVVAKGWRVRFCTVTLALKIPSSITTDRVASRTN